MPRVKRSQQVQGMAWHFDVSRALLHDARKAVHLFVSLPGCQDCANTFAMPV
jgi:hypothetical protein